LFLQLLTVLAEKPPASAGYRGSDLVLWERKHDRRPTSAPNDSRIEQALLARGVILFAEPTPGARLAEKR